MMSTKKAGDGVLNGFLDQGSHFKGELSFDDTMRIDGRFEGTIRSANQLIVGETAEIDADIQVGNVSIDGTVRGTIVAKSKIEIHPHGKVFAQLTAPTLKIEEGALFQGACAMEARKG